MKLLIRNLRINTSKWKRKRKQKQSNAKSINAFVTFASMASSHFFFPLPSQFLNFKSTRNRFLFFIERPNITSKQSNWGYLYWLNYNFSQLLLLFFWCYIPKSIGITNQNLSRSLTLYLVWYNATWINIWTHNGLVYFSIQGRQLSMTNTY